MGTQITNCQFCGQDHGVQCPAVKAIEYFENGKVKRVEFKSAADYMVPFNPLGPPLQPFPPPNTPWWWNQPTCGPNVSNTFGSS